MVVMFYHSQSYRDVYIYSPGLLEAERGLSESSCQQTTTNWVAYQTEVFPHSREASERPERNVSPASLMPAAHVASIHSLVHCHMEYSTTGLFSFTAQLCWVQGLPSTTVSSF